jgi:ectoine hydroxylase-related dioxygenase (phytanoyl-CoA dioxygenase family)
MIFTENFLRLDARDVADAVRTDGVYALENALTADFLQAIETDVAQNPFGINVNNVHGVYFGSSQFYVTHMLAVSQQFFSFCTHPKILEVCQHILGERFRLKAQRYYETYGGHAMRWHTDNKTDRGFAHIPGLIFIAYISDVEDGEFQYIRGSHNWSGEKAYNEYGAEFIAREHGKDVLSFRKPRGSLIIYDTYGIHRARPVRRNGFVRKSLFFQVDSKVEDGEPILLKTQYADTMDERLKQYLGFGKPSEYVSFPGTGLTHLPIRGSTLSMMARWMFGRTARAAYDSLSERAQDRLKTLLRRGR